MIRQMISSVPVPAKPAPSDAAAKMANPAANAYLRPKRSESRPAESTKTVDAIMYARITHTSANSDVCRLLSRVGRAMISVPELIVAISMPSDVHDNAHHL